MKTKHKKLIEKQKVKTKNAKKLLVVCISRADSGREVMTRIVGKEISWTDVSHYTLQTWTNDDESDHVYMVSLFEISRKAFYGDKNNEGLKEFRSHSSHFLVEKGEELCLGDYV